MVKDGAEIVFVPSAFTKFTGKDHWLALTRVRAIENQCYIVAVNQCGKNSDGVKFFGESVAFGPWGKEIGKIRGKKEGFSICEINLKKLRAIRKSLPALKKMFFSIKVIRKKQLP
jgi:nitrilase